MKFHFPAAKSREQRQSFGKATHQFRSITSRPSVHCWASCSPHTNAAGSKNRLPRGDRLWPTRQKSTGSARLQGKKTHWRVVTLVRMSSTWSVGWALVEGKGCGGGCRGGDGEGGTAVLLYCCSYHCSERNRVQKTLNIFALIDDTFYIKFSGSK